MIEEPDRTLEVRLVDNDVPGFADRVVELLLVEPPRLVDLSRHDAGATRINLHASTQERHDGHA